MREALRLRQLTVGHGQRAVVRDINLELPAGQLIGILGPNGSGKTTLLRTIARLLPPLAGRVCWGDDDLRQRPTDELARQLAVVLTERLELEQMTARDVCSLGRYPHTGFFGRLSAADHRIVQAALEQCGAGQLAERLFAQLSDGERQKVLIARALAQQPEILILDEPTVHLDLQHKLEILALLQRLTVSQGTTVLLTLHEPELAIKACDRLMLVKAGQVLAQGAVAEVVRLPAFAGLYGGAVGLNPLTGSMEFQLPTDQQLFVVGGAGTATPIYRTCARLGVGCATGVLHQGDLDYYTARDMAAPLISVPAFGPIGEADLEAAWSLASGCCGLIDSGFPIGTSNQANWRLLQRAQAAGRRLLSLRPESMLPGAEQLTSLDQLGMLFSARRKG